MGQWARALQAERVVMVVMGGVVTGPAGLGRGGGVCGGEEECGEGRRSGQEHCRSVGSRRLGSRRLPPRGSVLHTRLCCLLRV